MDYNIFKSPLTSLYQSKDKRWGRLAFRCRSRNDHS